MRSRHQAKRGIVANVECESEQSIYADYDEQKWDTERYIGRFYRHRLAAR